MFPFFSPADVEKVEPCSTSSFSSQMRSKIHTAHAYHLKNSSRAENKLNGKPALASLDYKSYDKTFFLSAFIQLSRLRCSIAEHSRCVIRQQRKSIESSNAYSFDKSTQFTKSSQKETRNVINIKRIESTTFTVSLGKAVLICLHFPRVFEQNFCEQRGILVSQKYFAANFFSQYFGVFRIQVEFDQINRLFLSLHRLSTENDKRSWTDSTEGLLSSDGGDSFMDSMCPPLYFQIVLFSTFQCLGNEIFPLRFIFTRHFGPRKP